MTLEGWRYVTRGGTGEQGRSERPAGKGGLSTVKLPPWQTSLSEAALLGQSWPLPWWAERQAINCLPTNLGQAVGAGCRRSYPRGTAKAPHLTPAHMQSPWNAGRTSRLSVIPLPRHSRGDPLRRLQTAFMKSTGKFFQHSS